MDDLRDLLRAFARDRDWEKFHTPKNLASALAVEAGELLEIFQWMTPDESERLDERSLEKVRDELADVLIYLTRLADRLDVDLLEAAFAKIERNRSRYPVEVSRGTAAKYDRLRDKP